MPKKTKKNKSRPQRTASALPERAVVRQIDETLAKPRRHLTRVTSAWHHPLMAARAADQPPVSLEELRAFAYDFYERFLPFFTEQPEGSLLPAVDIEFTTRMRQKLGLAYLFERKIRLNLSYFSEDPALLPYTLFHELTHVWLYDCLYDPGHTRRFYKKMAEFASTGLTLDPDVHIHTRVASEGKFVYCCPNCKNRWYLQGRLQHSIYCGHCHDREGVEFYAKRLKTTRRTAPKTTPTEDSDSAA